jgi:hypothetical protein
MDQPVLASIQTFDGFNYTIKIGKKTAEDNCYLNMNVTGDFPKERTPGTDEKPEDKEKLDKEFKDKLEKLQEKLKQEKAYEKWTYLVSKWTVDPLLKERKDLLVEKKDDVKTEESPAPSTAPTEPENDETKTSKSTKSAPPLPPLPPPLPTIEPTKEEKPAEEKPAQDKPADEKPDKDKPD